MPSLFPGVDPFVEAAGWGKFHLTFLTAFVRRTSPLVWPRYRVDAEEYVSFVPEPPDVVRRLKPDVFLAGPPPVVPGAAASTAVLEAPVSLDLPPRFAESQRYLLVRDMQLNEVVTVIEVLSPTNKRSGPGREQYLARRATILESRVNLVEIDLLRGGQPLPMATPLSGGAYYVLVSRGDKRPHTGVWPIGLRDPLPTFHLPLRPGDDEPLLDLQALYNSAYEDGGYSYSLDRAVPLDPPLGPDDEAWVRGVLAGAETRPS